MSDPIQLMFGDMSKLGPGRDEDTLHVLRQLPRQDFEVVVDVGSGTGRQTIALARALRSTIHAVDLHAPFLRELERRAVEAGVAPWVRTHCLDMRELANRFSTINLLWSEGAAYNIGFAEALNRWAAIIPLGSFAVVSELAWLRADGPAAVREFFRSAYPDMRSVDANRRITEAAGFKLLGTHTLPAAAWEEGYYDVLGPRAASWMDHADAEVRELAASTLKEIEIFELSEASYGYVFFLLERVER